MVKSTKAKPSPGVSIKAYPGDGTVLLTFDLDATLSENLAGFAVSCKPPQGKSYTLVNRLNFSTGITAKTKPQERLFTPSNEAPFQKYRWADAPSPALPGAYEYTVTAMYFEADGTLKSGSTATTSVELVPQKFANFELGFTRGALSSQAYARQFKNAPFRPEPHTIDYDTAPYEKQYEWLGFHARKMIFSFLEEAIADPKITVDLFAYDLDEPDFIRSLAQLGPRLRAVLDDAPLHKDDNALEPQVVAKLTESAGADNIKVGHFKRFSHCKVLIQKKNGKPIKVLMGSANFSVRGLYVQSNNVLIFNDAKMADLYEQAFEQAFTDMKGFGKSPIAQDWFELNSKGIPATSVCFSPHTSADISLTKVGDAIEKADSSVLYAIMGMTGGGRVLDGLKALGANPDIFSYGVTQTTSGLDLYKPDATNGMLVPFSYLKRQVPPPFDTEWEGGMGRVIHHKFVVVDFNGKNPIVFTGSSNLAAGGEEANGDSLLAITEPSIVTAYAVEAIRLVDHYHFRAAMSKATKAEPLALKGNDRKWWQAYYDPKNIKCTERLLFAKS
jgi:PLD-like domain